MAPPPSSARARAQLPRPRAGGRRVRLHPARAELRGRAAKPRAAEARRRGRRPAVRRRRRGRGRALHAASRRRSAARTGGAEAAARVLLDLRRRRRLGTAGEQAQHRCRGRQRHRQSRRRGVRGAGDERALDDPVLQRVVGQHDDPAADRERVDRGRQGAPASASSSPLTSIRSAWKVRLAGLPAGTPGGRRDRARTSSASRAGDGERLAGRARDDRVGDPPGEPLLAVLPQHPRQVRRPGRC